MRGKNTKTKPALNFVGKMKKKPYKKTYKNNNTLNNNTLRHSSPHYIETLFFPVFCFARMRVKVNAKTVNSKQTEEEGLVKVCFPQGKTKLGGRN